MIRGGVQASRMSLPQTFPFAQGAAYEIQVTHFMGSEK
jgi:hypothetical protein